MTIFFIIKTEYTHLVNSSLVIPIKKYNHINIGLNRELFALFCQTEFNLELIWIPIGAIIGIKGIFSVTKG
jgi:hypothetical protein